MKNKKIITIELVAKSIDSLARAVGKGFEEVEKKMTATKEEMREGFCQIRKEMKGMMTKEDFAAVVIDLATKDDINELRQEIEKRPTRGEMMEEISKFRYAKEIDEVRGRVKVCEEKLGIAG